MKISPMGSTGNVAPAVEGQGAKVETLRALKMSTNATPGPAGPQEPLISDDNEPDINKNNSEAEATQPISPQMAALARQRRALQVKEREIADREKALEAKSQGSDAVPIARLKSETLKVLQEAGITYDDLTAAILGNQGNSELDALKAQIAALEQGVDKKFLDRETQAEQQVLAEMRREADRLIANGDDFEMVRETQSVPDVMKLIERTYRETGEVLEVNDALKLVEDELFARNQKLLGLKKMQALIPQPAPQPQQRTQGMRTLTNKDTASVPADRRARALGAFYGTLKK